MGTAKTKIIEGWKKWCYSSSFFSLNVPFIIQEFFTFYFFIWIVVYPKFFLYFSNIFFKDFRFSNFYCWINIEGC